MISDNDAMGVILVDNAGQVIVRGGQLRRLIPSCSRIGSATQAGSVDSLPLFATTVRAAPAADGGAAFSAVLKSFRVDFTSGYGANSHSYNASFSKLKHGNDSYSILVQVLALEKV